MVKPRFLCPLCFALARRGGLQESKCFNCLMQLSLNELQAITPRTDFVPTDHFLLE
jgi:hypothetical protein